MRMKSLPLYAIIAGIFTLASCAKDDTDECNCIEDDGRYSEELFTSVRMDSVQYDASHNLWMDIYTPEGDDATDRRLVMLAHGGAFVYGSRKNVRLVELAENLARRGYVAVSYSYRLAPDINTMYDSIASLGVVVRSMVDGTNALRYMMSSASAGNEYGIDPDEVALGGTSAGGVLSLHMAFVDQNDSLSANLHQHIMTEGGWEAHLNQTSSNRIKAVISLAGGLHKTSWMDANGPELVMAHGTWDPIVPYYCGNALNNPAAVQLCGTGSIVPEADALGIDHSELIFPETAHVPWNDDADMWDQVLIFTLEELDKAME